MSSERIRDTEGKLRSSKDMRIDSEGNIYEVKAQEFVDEAKGLHGYNNLKAFDDYIEEMNHWLEKLGLKKGNEKTDKHGFTKDFYEFLRVPKRPRDYQHPLAPQIAKKYDMLQGDTTTAPFYTPLDNMYGTPTGGDTWYDRGRVPVSHLMPLASKRLGVIYRACNGVSHDVVDNGFDFVKYSDMDTPLDPKKNKLIEEILGWMRRTRFKRKIVEILDWDCRSGLGHLIVEKYLKQSRSYKNWQKKSPPTKPEKFVTFSSFYMTPNNIYQPDRLDYDRQLWNFTGGLQGASNIHHSRVYVMEMRREELGLRGIALAETCWVACMCYLNIQYYILKSLAQLGNVMVGVQVDQEYPTPTTVSHYLSVLNTMRANNFYVLGRGAQFLVQNAISQLGSGINDFMEFLKEELSAAFIVPKNQFFGRSEGGGLSGAGAVVTKEDYLGSNISTKQLILTDEMMYILTEICNFIGLDDITVKFNIDLLKTKEQQLKEKMMEEQLAQQEVITKQSDLSFGLFKKQIKLQKQIADVQLQLLEEDPEGFMDQSGEDEENLQEKPVKKGEDFVERIKPYLQKKLDFLQYEFKNNSKLLNWINRNTKELGKIQRQNDFVWRNEIKMALKE